MKKFLRRLAQRNKLSKEQKKFLADVCKTLAITGFILPAIANQFLPQLEIKLGFTIFTIACGGVLILTGLRIHKRD